MTPAELEAEVRQARRRGRGRSLDLQRDPLPTLKSARGCTRPASAAARASRTWAVPESTS